MDPTIESMQLLVREVMPERVTRLERIVCALIHKPLPAEVLKAQSMPAAAANIVEFARQLEKSMDAALRSKLS